MIRKLIIELENEIFQQLNERCKGDKNVIQDFIAQILKENLNQSNVTKPPEKKDCLESYLKKGQSGSRKYGVKGQGW